MEKVHELKAINEKPSSTVKYLRKIVCYKFLGLA